jgi:hypothetical protein
LRFQIKETWIYTKYTVDLFSSLRANKLVRNNIWHFNFNRFSTQANEINCPSIVAFEFIYIWDPDTPGGTKGSINSFHSFIYIYLHICFYYLLPIFIKAIIIDSIAKINKCEPTTLWNSRFNHYGQKKLLSISGLSTKCGPQVSLEFCGFQHWLIYSFPVKFFLYWREKKVSSTVSNLLILLSMVLVYVFFHNFSGFHIIHNEHANHFRWEKHTEINLKRA